MCDLIKSQFKISYIHPVQRGIWSCPHPCTIFHPFVTQVVRCALVQIFSLSNSNTEVKRFKKFFLQLCTAAWNKRPSLPASLIMLSSSEYVWSGGKENTSAGGREATSGEDLEEMLLHPAWHAPHVRVRCLEDWKTNNDKKYVIPSMWVVTSQCDWALCSSVGHSYPQLNA